MKSVRLNDCKQLCARCHKQVGMRFVISAEGKRKYRGKSCQQILQTRTCLPGMYQNKHRFRFELLFGNVSTFERF